MSINVPIQTLMHAENLPLPAYATEQSAGLDVMAAIEEDITISPGERKLVPAGFAMALPDGYEAQIRPRSGLAFKHGITVLNTPGTIDADYRGEVKVLLINLGQEAFVVSRSMRIAQMVIAPVSRIAFAKTNDLDETVRGEGGFGSTGVMTA